MKKNKIIIIVCCIIACFILSIALFLVTSGYVIDGVLYGFDPGESEIGESIISTLENCFGKEGNFKIIETKMEKGYMGEKNWSATVSTSYFDSTFTYNYNNDNHSKFLDELCKNKYGIDIGDISNKYLISDNNPYFLVKKQEYENMLNTINKNNDISYGYSLQDLDFKDFGKLPTIEDITNKTTYYAYVVFYNQKNDYESILIDVKQILSFSEQKCFWTTKEVVYYKEKSDANKYSNAIKVFITDETKRVEIHIGENYKTYTYNENLEFTERIQNQ